MAAEAPDRVQVVAADAGTDWPSVLALLNRAFAFMAGRIDPPSSLSRLDADGLAMKARSGVCLLARDGAALVGCVFCEEQGEALYIGKLAVEPACQGHGIGGPGLNQFTGFCSK